LSLNHELGDDDGSTPDGKQSAPLLNEDGDPIWKILVFDNLGRDVISSVLRVNDLRAQGVTIHLSVKDQVAAGSRLTTAQKHQLSSIPNT